MARNFTPANKTFDEVGSSDEEDQEGVDANPPDDLPNDFDHDDLEEEAQPPGHSMRQRGQLGAPK